MKTIEQLANLAAVRNHIMLLVNSSKSAVPRESVHTLTSLATKLDKEFVEAALEAFPEQTTQKKKRGAKQNSND